MRSELDEQPSTLGNDTSAAEVNDLGTINQDEQRPRRFNWPNGSYYEGEWDSGRFAGQGTFFWPTSSNETLAEKWKSCELLNAVDGQSRVSAESTHNSSENYCILQCCWREGLPHGPAVLTTTMGHTRRQVDIDRGRLTLDGLFFVFDHDAGRFTDCPDDPNWRCYAPSESEDKCYSESDDSQWFVREGCGTLTFADGGVYDGFWKHEKPHGQGRLRLGNGDTYEGNWELGVMKGHGVYKFVDGGSFTGEFLMNRRHGFGALKSPDGIVYEGFWVNDKPHGHGRILMSQGSATYDGQWVAGVPHGQGRYSHAESGKYNGQWNHGSRDGVAYAIYVDGASYDGHWVDDFPHGRGIYRWADGTTLEGEWLKGTLDGYGTYRHADGSLYEGQWHINVKSGFGLYRFADGALYEGRWANDKPNGSGIFSNPQGIQFRGHWENGTFSDGVGILTCQQTSESVVEQCKEIALENVATTPTMSWPPGHSITENSMPELISEVSEARIGVSAIGIAPLGNHSHKVQLKTNVEKSPVFCDVGQSAPPKMATRSRGWIPAKPPRLTGYQYKSVIVNEIACEGVDFCVTPEELSSKAAMISDSCVGSQVDRCDVGIDAIQLACIAMNSSSTQTSTFVEAPRSDGASVIERSPATWSTTEKLTDEAGDCVQKVIKKVEGTNTVVDAAVNCLPTLVRVPADVQTENIILSRKTSEMVDDSHMELVPPHVPDVAESTAPAEVHVSHDTLQVETVRTDMPTSQAYSATGTPTICFPQPLAQHTISSCPSCVPTRTSIVVEPLIIRSSPLPNAHVYRSSLSFEPQVARSSFVPGPQVTRSSFVSSPQVTRSAVTPEPQVTRSFFVPSSQVTRSSIASEPQMTRSSFVPCPEVTRSSIASEPQITRSSVGGSPCGAHTHHLVMPEVNIVDVEKVVEVPHLVEQIIVREKRVPQYVERHFPEYRDVHISKEVERCVPIPVEVDCIKEFQFPKIRPVYRRVDMPIYAPRFIDVPVPVDSLDQETIDQITSLGRILDDLAAHTSPSMARFEEVAQAMNSSGLDVQNCLANSNQNLASMADNGTLKVDDSSLHRIQSFTTTVPQSRTVTPVKINQGSNHRCGQTETTRSGLDSRSTRNEVSPQRWNYSDSISSTPRWRYGDSEMSQSPSPARVPSERPLVIPKMRVARPLP